LIDAPDSGKEKKGGKMIRDRSKKEGEGPRGIVFQYIRPGKKEKKKKLFDHRHSSTKKGGRRQYLDCARPGKKKKGRKRPYSSRVSVLRPREREDSS